MDYRIRIICLLLFVAMFIILMSRESSESKRKNEQDFQKVVAWLERNAPGSEKNKDAFRNAGIIKLGNLCLLGVEVFQYLSSQPYWSLTAGLKESLQKLKMELAFQYWLKSLKMDDLYTDLSDFGIDNLEKMVGYLDYNKASSIIKNDKGRLTRFWGAVKVVKNNKHLGFNHYPVGIEISLLTKIFIYLWKFIVIIAKLAVLITVIAVIIVWAIAVLIQQIVSRIFRTGSNTAFRNFIRNLSRNNRPRQAMPLQNPPIQPQLPLPGADPGSSIFGRIFNALFRTRATTNNHFPLNASQTKFEFLWEENTAVVGEMRSFSVTFYKNYFAVCKPRDVNNARAEITVNGEEVPCTIEMDDANSFLVKFTPLISGSYKILFSACGKHVKTHYKPFLPGSVDPTKTTLKTAQSTIVMKENEASEIVLDERDKYGNKCNSSEVSLTKYQFEVHKIQDDLIPINPDVRVVQQPNKLAITLTFSDSGCYQTSVTYDKQPILKNVLHAVVLSEENWNKIQSDVKRQSWNLWYEAYLLPDSETEDSHKRRKVYCYITSKVITIKEYYLKIFPKRLHSLRMKPSTKLTLLPKAHTDTGFMVLKIEENSGNFISLALKERDLFAATFTQMLLRNVGGFDSFDNKRRHLYSELRKIYSKKSKFQSTISVHRETLLHDAMKATKRFSDADWGKIFTIVFIGENGLDFGGLRRELFQLICDALFKSKNKIFQNLGKDDAQSMVHPNPFRPEEFRKLKYFEFAGKIVGKLIIDCAHDRQQYIRARFSRSFLAQIMGLGVSWKHFETDDKEFYNTKVNYILKNDVEDLEMTFTEDVYDQNQVFMKTVELKPYGSQIAVTNKNKKIYLQLVAEYRLVNSTKDEISAFIKGLNSLVPDSLLSMFDENELELLICGIENISVKDLQQNFVKCGGGGGYFDTVLEWFWEILLAFNQEELSRLVQFTTGCSQLPPGGFKDLSPRFQIMAYPGTNALPSAHTCFNMLCLPNYSCKEEFRRLLLIALNEGSEGFGLV